MLAPLLFTYALSATLTPMRSAQTIPPGQTRIELNGGLTMFRLDLPSLPIMPIITGSAEVAHGLTSWLDARVWLRTELGLVNRLGAELRARAVQNRRFAIGARLAPSTQLSGSFKEGVDYSGDFSTEASLLVTVFHPRFALTLDSGPSVQWAVYESIAGQRRSDVVPLLRSVNVALEAEWMRTRHNMTLRLELNGSLLPDDPFSIHGFYPRLLFGSNFSL